MRKFLLTFVLSVSFLTSTFYTPKTHALAGLIFKSKTTNVIGGIAAIGGIGVATHGYITASTATTLGAGIGGFVILSLGAGLAGLGLILLDDKQVADIEFKPINQNYKDFSQEQIYTYNQELDLLNTIRQSIINEISESESTDESKTLWLEYSKYMSDSTFEIAQSVAQDFIRAL